MRRTARACLDRTGNKWSPDGQANIPRTYVACPSSGVFEAGRCDDERELPDRLPRYPLHGHAGHCWRGAC